MSDSYDCRRKKHHHKVKRGPTGPQGEQGPQGERGYIGPRGPQGCMGYQGCRGKRGKQGEQGEQGPTGPAGQDGQQGPTGPAGQDGQQGPTGPQGITGEQGPTGPSGGDLITSVSGTNGVTVSPTIGDVVVGLVTSTQGINSQITWARLDGTDDVQFTGEYEGGMLELNGFNWIWLRTESAACSVASTNGNTRTIVTTNIPNFLSYCQTPTSKRWGHIWYYKDDQDTEDEGLYVEWADPNKLKATFWRKNKNFNGAKTLTSPPFEFESWLTSMDYNYLGCQI